MAIATVGSLFSGIGGIDYAFQAAGFRIAWQVEIDTFCHKVLAKHFPEATRYTDIYDCHQLPHVDVLTAGFPCQPFSSAGRRLGAQDKRYLIPEMFRVIRKVQPRVILFENVVGFTNIADGNTFREFLRALAESGYDAEWCHLRASDVSAPHKRERWLCVAYAQSDGSERIGRAVEETPRHSWQPHVRRYAYRKDQTRAYGNRRNVQRERSDNIASVGGNVDGLSERLYGHRFPARPGCPQHPDEPPRIETNVPNQEARIQALGNSVVPQLIYATALTIREWLEGQQNSEVAA